jgi:hypothetical protein
MWHLFNLYIISWWSNSFALVWTSTRLTCSSFGRVTNQSLSMMPIPPFIIDGIVGSGRGGEVRGEILTARVDFSCQSLQLPLLSICQRGVRMVMCVGEQSIVLLQIYKCGILWRSISARRRLLHALAAHTFSFRSMKRSGRRSFGVSSRASAPWVGSAVRFYLQHHRCEEHIEILSVDDMRTTKPGIGLVRIVEVVASPWTPFPSLHSFNTRAIFAQTTKRPVNNAIHLTESGTCGTQCYRASKRAAELSQSHDLYETKRISDG